MLNRTPANVEISCGMFRNVVLKESFEFPKFNYQHEDCNSKSCEISGFMQVYDQPDKSVTNETEVHVIAVHSGPPIKFSSGGQIRRGKPIYVRVRATEKPIDLVLVNKNRMRWKLDLDEGAQINKLVVASKSLTWVEGQPDNTPIEYLSPSSMCAYPYAFEDHKNPDNVFRRMVSALRLQLNQNEKSFQAAKNGLGFVVPFYEKEDEEVQRVVKYRMKQKARRSPSRIPASIKGLDFEVRGFQLSPRSISEFKDQGTENMILENVPEQLQSFVRTTSGMTYVIHRHQFGKWEEGNFTPVYTPIELPDLKWPVALAYQVKSKEVWITSQDGDGRIYGFTPETKKWRLVSESSGANIRALVYSPKLDRFFGIQNRSEIDQIIEINPEGEVRRSVFLSQKIPFLKSDWYPELSWAEKGLVLRLAKPSQPLGDFYTIDVQKGTARKIHLQDVKTSSAQAPDKET